MAGSALLLLAALLLAGPALGGPALGGEEPLVGAPEAIRDPGNDQGLQEALRFAVAEYNGASNDRFSSKVVRIISARRQIVSGVNYIMEVEFARTTCLKPPSDLQSCPIQPRSKRIICNFTVYVAPWKNKMELTERRCHKAYHGSRRDQWPVA